MQNLGGLAKNIYIGDMATAVFSEIAGQKNAGRGLFAETTASQVRHNNNFINNYRYIPTYYYLQEKMGKTDSKRYYFGKLSVAPNVDGIGIGHAYTTDMDEHAFNMGFVSSPDFEDFQTQLGELLLSKSRNENYYKDILKSNSGITSVDQQFIASGITELKRGERYTTPEEKNILNPDEHGDIKSLYKKESEKEIYNNIARENYKDLNIDNKKINKWDDAKISYNVDNINKKHHVGLYEYYIYNGPSSVELQKGINEFGDGIYIKNYLSDQVTKDYKSLVMDFLIDYKVPTEEGVENKFLKLYDKTDHLFDLYKNTRIKTNSYKSSFYRFPLLEQQMLYDIGELKYKVGNKHKAYSNLPLEDIKGTLGLNGSYYDEYGIDSGFTTLNISSATSKNYSSLINKTNELFKSGTIKTLINRYNTKEDGSGLSRGRNLSGTSNCRVWTAFKQYSKIENLIRPLTKSEGGFKTLSEVQEKYGQLRPNDGHTRLSNNSVLQPNGFVKITPTHDEGTYENIKNYMFSIENLAWKDIDIDDTLSAEQRGPNNGRIMWFPPYNLKFSENVNVNWNGNSFIGRGEQIYTYTNTERSGTLDFTLLIDHPSILNKWRGTGDIINKKEEKEMELLKYFAGCGELEVDSSRDGYSGGTSTGKTAVTETGEYTRTEKEAIILFFPNAYYHTSGDDDTIDIDKTIENLKTYECKDVIGDFKGELNVPSQSLNKQSFYWLNDFNSLPENSNDIKYESYDIDKFIKRFPEYNGDEVGENEIIKKYFGGNSPRFNTVEKGSKVDTDYQNNPSDINSPYIYRTLEKSGDTIVYKYYIKNSHDIGFNVIGKFSDKIYNAETNDSIKLYSFKDLVDESEPFKLKTSNKDNITITIESIRFGGSATKVGTENINNPVIAKQRREVTKSIFEKKIGTDYTYIMDEPLVNDVKEGDVNSLEHKINRIGYIIIEYKIKGENLTQTQAAEEGFISASNLEVDNNKENAIPIRNSREIFSYIENGYTYDNEYLYFKNLKNNDNFIYKNIVDKVRFFDPAFHSMTPEGFNARLSFLHQCTRQGPTSQVTGTNFAGNLAFGRAPYCILRIGDFFHTKICIDSMSIQYDNGGGVQWDLNPEGVGVQPMYATISLNFKFIGGQDISGPIERLQNAVTSNYYANTSIYDPRADYWIKDKDNKDNEYVSTYIIPTKY